MKQKKWAWLCLGLLLVGSAMYGSTSTAPVAMSWWGFPRYVWGFFGLQLLLALGIWLFGQDVWEVEAAEECKRAKTQASEE